jgi:hypothetical protein
VSSNSRNGAAPRLSDSQRNEYESLKLGIVQDVKTGLQAFQRAGEKLLKIRQDRLYREEFGTFEDFSREILGHSKTYSNNLIVGFQVVQALVAQGETVLPDSERVARQLAKYPKGDRILIWKRALQIGGKKKPDYKVIREAATQIVPTKAVQKIWVGQLFESLRTAKRALTISADFSGVPRESLEKVAGLLVDIEKRVAEISVPVGKRIEEIEREESRGEMRGRSRQNFT